MFDFKDKEVLVIGLGGRARAACEMLRRQGATVMAVDSANTEASRDRAARLRPLGVEVALGVTVPPKRDFNFAVLSPAVPATTQLVQAIKRANVPLIGELELGYQQSKCLSIAVAGSNGKSTTAELIERILAHNQRKTVLSGHCDRPVCSVIEQTKELDFLVLQVNSFQLEATEFFRPAVAVLTALAPDHLDRYSSPADYSRANARLFQNQQSFDWAIIQSQALARLRELDLEIPAKTITFSATDPEADIHLERGLLLSRLPNWSGPLLDMDHCQLNGPHNAENLMGALAVGHVLRVPLERMLEPIRDYRAGPHRCEVIGEINGVHYINDSKGSNVEALRQALLTARAGAGGQPNVWIIAGGKDKGLDYHDVGPVLARRAKHAFLVGEAAEKIRSAWSLFIPCTILNSLVEAVTEAASRATSGDVVLLSPACSSLDQFRNYQERGEMFCRAVKSISRGAISSTPNMDGKIRPSSE